MQSLAVQFLNELIELSPRALIRLGWALAVVVALLFVAVNLQYGGGLASVPQADALIFEHYARALAEGHPYRIDASSLPSTGSTSHLYPALLAVFYLIGMRGDALATAALALNIGFYFLSLGLIFSIARRVAPRAAPLALVLSALSGQMAFAFMATSDIGLFTMLALAIFWAALAGRTRLLGTALVLAVWTRPEGIVITGLLTIAVLAAPARARGGLFARHRGAYFKACLCGIAAIMAMFALNRALTGQFGFQSVQGKGNAFKYSAWGSAAHTAADYAQMMREMLFGGAMSERNFYIFPVLGGMLALIGIGARLRRSPRLAVLLWWAASIAVCLVPVAQSGWQGTQMDKYWTWMLPALTIAVAAGVIFIDRVKLRAGRAAREGRAGVSHAGALLVFFLTIYGALGVVRAAGLYNQACASMALGVQFLKQVDLALPDGAPVGGNGMMGAGYYLPHRNYVNLSGIGSPEFLGHPEPLSNIELLRHRPELRPPYWLLLATGTEGFLKPFMGPQRMTTLPIFSTSSAYALHEADYSALAALTPTSATMASLRPGAVLVDSLDVGFDADEARTHYDLYTRIPGGYSKPFVYSGDSSGTAVVEVGRLIAGSETFTIKTQPGKPLTAILRGTLRASAIITSEGLDAPNQEFSFTPPLRLNVICDDQDLAPVILDKAPERGAVFELPIAIPAKMVTTDRTTITVGGDHLSLGYWFYQ